MKTKWRNIRVSAHTRRTLNKIKKTTGLHSLEDVIVLLTKAYCQVKGVK